MRASSSGNPNTQARGHAAQVSQQFNTTQIAQQAALQNQSALNKTTSFLSAAGINMANGVTA